MLNGSSRWLYVFPRTEKVESRSREVRENDARFTLGIGLAQENSDDVSNSCSEALTINSEEYVWRRRRLIRYQRFPGGKRM